MDRGSIALDADSVHIFGEHFRVPKGFITKIHGATRVNYADLLAVEIFKRRSKKLMVATLFLGGIVIFAVDVIDVFALLVALAVVGVVGIAYLLSLRQYVEITSMCGTFRVELRKDDIETKKVVTQLRQCIK